MRALYNNSELVRCIIGVIERALHVLPPASYQWTRGRVALCEG